MWAVKCAEERVSTDGDATVTETVKVSYRQDWTAYNAAQCEEKTRFTALLSDLCADVPQAPAVEPVAPGFPCPIWLASVFKAYSGFSLRRFTSDLRDAQERGYISPHAALQLGQ